MTDVSTGGFLARHWDPGLKVGDERVSDFEHAERERLAQLLAVANAAAEVPRRLGPDASEAELSSDRRRCKRIAHVAAQCLIAWTGKPVTVKKIDRDAVQVRWSLWWEEHQTYLLSRRRYISTWALVPGRNKKDVRWAKSAVVRLDNEQQWLEYAFRD